MEKQKPTYDLDAIKSVADDPDKLEITTTATLSAAALGFDREMIISTIKSIERKHFYKSMTTIANHKIWQDVYHFPSSVGLLYIKFVAGNVLDFALVGFKKK